MERLPDETVIKYNRGKLLWLVLSPLILIGSLYLFLRNLNVTQQIMAFFGSAVGLILTIFSFQDISEVNKPHLVISKKGIEHRNGQHFEWAEILKEEIVYLGRHHKVAHLSLKTTQGDRLFKIDEWNQPPEKILALLTRYKN